MIKLSQRAWNNVIIVSMLMLIVLFNFSSNFLNGGVDDNPSVQSLVPPDKIITTIQFAQHKVERVGQGWRSTFGNANNDTLSALVQRWQDAEVSVFEGELSFQSQPAALVEVWFAGQAEPTEYQFMQLTDKTLVKVDNRDAYQLDRPSLKQLNIPE